MNDSAIKKIPPMRRCLEVNIFVRNKAIVVSLRKGGRRYSGFHLGGIQRKLVEFRRAGMPVGMYFIQMKDEICCIYRNKQGGSGAIDTFNQQRLISITKSSKKPFLFKINNYGQHIIFCGSIVGSHTFKQY